MALKSILVSTTILFYQYILGQINCKKRKDKRSTEVESDANKSLFLKYWIINTIPFLNGIGKLESLPVFF
jgi:hypothetical protein